MREAAERAGVGQKTIRRRIEAGELVAYNVRGTSKIVVLEADVDRVFALERVQPRPRRAQLARPKPSRRAAGPGSRERLQAIEREA